MAAEAVIRTQKLGKVYPSPAGDVVAVEDLDLEVQAGQILGLLGPNGAGKTTTTRMLCGLVRPSTGQILVNGIPVGQHPNEIRRQIGLVPEEAGDHPNLTLAEELAYHGAFYGLNRHEVRQRSTSLIDRLNLSDRVNHRLKTFSRGMRRKFHLIRALLHRPRILLLDEPTAGLDPQSAEEIWNLFKSMAVEQQVTVVLCSHHLEEVERLCDRVAILKRRLLMEGTLAELRNQDSRYRVTLAGPAAPLAAAVEGISGVGKVDASDARLHLRLRDKPSQVVPEVVRCLVEQGAAVLEVVREDRDLRSLYRSAIEAQEQSDE